MPGFQYCFLLIAIYKLEEFELFKSNIIEEKSRRVFFEVRAEEIECSLLPSLTSNSAQISFLLLFLQGQRQKNTAVVDGYIVSQINKRCSYRLSCGMQDHRQWGHFLGA